MFLTFIKFQLEVLEFLVLEFLILKILKISDIWEKSFAEWS